MSEPALLAIIAAIGAIGAAAVGAFGVVLGLLWRRIAKLETRERAIWWWARAIADMYYRHRKPDAPDLPPPPNPQEEP